MFLHMAETPRPASASGHAPPSFLAMWRLEFELSSLSASRTFVASVGLGVTNTLRNPFTRLRITSVHQGRNVTPHIHPPGQRSLTASNGRISTIDESGTRFLQKIHLPNTKPRTIKVSPSTSYLYATPIPVSDPMPRAMKAQTHTIVSQPKTSSGVIAHSPPRSALLEDRDLPRVVEIVLDDTVQLNVPRGPTRHERLVELGLVEALDGGHEVLVRAVEALLRGAPRGVAGGELGEVLGVAHLDLLPRQAAAHDVLPAR